MIKLTKTHRHKHRTLAEWRDIVISYALRSYELNGRLVASDVRRLVGQKVDELYSDIDGLIMDAGLPADALYGSADCAYCGIKFVKGDVSAKYCCREHQVISSSRKRAGRSGVKDEKLSCSHCGSLFEIGDRAKKYCTTKCRNKEISRSGKRKRRAASSATYSYSYSVMDVVNKCGTKCGHCGIETRVDCSPNADYRMNIDHIIPLSRGGHDAIYNCQILCRKCNIKKGNKILALDYSLAMKSWPSVLDFEAILKTERVGVRNTSGAKGVFFDNGKAVWFAQIEKQNKRIRIRCDSKEHAEKVRRFMRDLLSKGVELCEIKQEALKCRCQESHKL